MREEIDVFQWPLHTSKPKPHLAQILNVVLTDTQETRSERSFRKHYPGGNTMVVQIRNYYAGWSPTKHHGYVITYWEGGTPNVPAMSSGPICVF